MNQNFQNLIERKQIVSKQRRQTSVTPVSMFNIVNWHPADTPRCIKDSLSVVAVCKLHRQFESSDDAIQSARRLTVSLLSWPVIDVPAVTCRGHGIPTWNACSEQVHTAAHMCTFFTFTYVSWLTQKGVQQIYYKLNMLFLMPTQQYLNSEGKWLSSTFNRKHCTLQRDKHKNAHPDFTATSTFGPNTERAGTKNSSKHSTMDNKQNNYTWLVFTYNIWLIHCYLLILCGCSTMRNNGEVSS